jgi:hypothetical protein
VDGVFHHASCIMHYASKTMTTVDYIGTAGVTILLLAYLLLLIKVVTSGSKVYIWMNIIGAGLSTLASVFLKYIPFVILEGVWMMVSVVTLVRKK